LATHAAGLCPIVLPQFANLKPFALNSAERFRLPAPPALDSARLFALLNMPGTDAYMAAWAINEKFDFWRPVTAIRNAASLGNQALTVDPNWEPLVVTPAHPTTIGPLGFIRRRRTGAGRLICSDIVAVRVTNRATSRV
jgi:hypothetical protein